MTIFLSLPFAAALFSLALAFASLLRKHRSPATWCFAAGMVALGSDSLFTGLSLLARDDADVILWLTRGFIAKSFAPVLWVGFSLMYSRGDSRELLAKWRIPLVVLGLLPVGVSSGLGGQLFQVLSPETPESPAILQFGLMARAVNVVLLVGAAVTLMNLEQTFRSAVGTMRWRIKFVVLAVAVIFGARLYVRSQGILYSSPDPTLWVIESAALLIGCAFLALAYGRTGLHEVDVYPSLTAVRSSVTLLLVGGYLFIVGVLAQLVRRLGGVESFQFQALVVLLGMAGLGVVLLSDRIRQRIHDFSVRHFKRAQHDSLKVWALFSHRLANVRDHTGVSAASARLISETFDALSVTVWLRDEDRAQLVVATSTAQRSSDSSRPEAASSAVVAGLRSRSGPFDLDAVDEPWAEEMRRLNATAFAHGGHRWCVPLRAADGILGALVLADRVNGAAYTVEEAELLRCIGDHLASALVNLQLANELGRARELEAFRTMSAFFVHDLKNAAASLNLMLKNLPVHFDDPAFREDALRGIGNIARRIDEMIARLGALRQPTGFAPVDADLNQIVSGAIDGLPEIGDVELTQALGPLPRIRADREQMRSLVANLILNARDATGAGGRIEVRTDHRDGRVMLSVADNGCGMSPAFLRESLFRPFQSTKKQGLGIGMFQSKMVVERHGGSMHVESEVGRGTTFLVSFPAPLRFDDAVPPGLPDSLA